MAKFKYRMQNILNLKYKLEEQQKIALGNARARLNEEEEKLETLYMTKASYARALTDIVSGKLDFSRIKLYREAYVNIDILIEEQKSEVAYCEKLVDEETAKMNEAMQQRKIHEKLREKAFKRFLDEVAYEENQMVDELFAYQYGVQGSNSTDERSTDS